MGNDTLLGRKVADRFTIKRTLGEGGMATVYVAEQDREPREVALKIMNEALTADQTFVQRFRREAQTATRLQHPGSVRIISYGVASGLPYIAMELLKGLDLYVLLQREGPMSQRRAASILADVCDVLSAAHDLGIVHRDLKPENIMVVADPSSPSGERVKVLDFGIAKLLFPETSAAERGSRPEEVSAAITRAGAFIGTPAYMSPEQCNLQPVDGRADIYTCGVLLFQLITGRVPFQGESPLHTATLHIQEEPPRPSDLAKGIDLRLEAIILKALSKKPSARQPTARHLGEALRRLAAELPDVPAVVDAAPSSAPEIDPEAEELPHGRDSDPTTRYVAPKKPSLPVAADLDTAQTLIRRSVPDLLAGSPGAEAIDRVQVARDLMPPPATPHEDPDNELADTVRAPSASDYVRGPVPVRISAPTPAPVAASVRISAPAPAPVPVRAPAPAPVAAHVPVAAPALAFAPAPLSPSALRDMGNPGLFVFFFSTTLVLTLLLVAYYFLVASPLHH